MATILMDTTFHSDWESRTDEDFFDWYPRLRHKNLLALASHLDDHGLTGVMSRSAADILCPGVATIITDTQEQYPGAVLRPFKLPHAILPFPPRFNGLHVWVISVPAATTEDIATLSRRGHYDGGLTKWPTLWERTASLEFGTDAMPLNVTSNALGESIAVDASECGAVLVIYASKDHLAFAPMLGDVYDLWSHIPNYKPFREHDLNELQASVQRVHHAIRAPNVLPVWTAPATGTRLTPLHSSDAEWIELEVAPDASSSPTSDGTPRLPDMHVLLRGNPEGRKLLLQRLGSIHWKLLTHREGVIGAALCFEDVDRLLLNALLRCHNGSAPVRGDIDSCKQALSRVQLTYEDYYDGGRAELCFPGFIRTQMLEIGLSTQATVSPDIYLFTDEVQGCLRRINPYPGVVKCMAACNWEPTDSLRR